MKKRNGLARALPVVAKGELEQLSTGALLARLQRLRWCEDTRDFSDLTDEEIASIKGQILFEEQPEWREAYRHIKDVLAGGNTSNASLKGY